MAERKYVRVNLGPALYETAHEQLRIIGDAATVTLDFRDAPYELVVMVKKLTDILRMRRESAESLSKAAREAAANA